MTPNGTTNVMTNEMGFPPKTVCNQFKVVFVCLFIFKGQKKSVLSYI